MCFISSDGGISWTRDPDRICGKNMVVQPVGGELMIPDFHQPKPTDPDNNNRRHHNRFFTADAADQILTPTYWIESYGLSTRGPTMPGKFTRGAAGQLYYVSADSRGCTNPGNCEEIGGCQIWRSSDSGQTWTGAATAHDQATFGLNLQAGTVVDVGDGTLKAFFRTPYGSLYESDSDTVLGVLWTPPVPSPLTSTNADFGVTGDTITGYHYAVWEYNDRGACRVNCVGINRPRTRMALAVSTDGMETWRFVMDLDDWQGHLYRHMNHSIAVIDDAVWVLVARRYQSGTEFTDNPTHRTRAWRIEKGLIESSVSFPELRPIVPWWP